MPAHRRLVHGVLAAALALGVSIAASAQEKSKDVSDLRQKADSAFQAQLWPDAAKLYMEVVAVTPDDANAWHHLGYSLHVLGKLDEALKAHAKAAEFPQTAGIASYNAACAYSLKKEPDKAFEWLDKAIAAGFAAANYMDTDTDLDNVRSDPRFAKIRKELAKSDRQQAFIASTPRTSTRLAFFGQGASAGQIAIDYGQPTWREDFGAAVESKKYAGQRWRLGQDFWTTWDSFCDVTLGETKIPAGHYFLALKQNDDGTFALEFLDSAAVRQARLDAFAVQRYTGPALSVALTAKKTDVIAKQLQFQLAHESEGKGSLSIAFGPYKAGVPLVVDMPKSGS
jgi:tetratricopeptide (TPR) repeat protein